MDWKALVDALLAWYDASARVLPWRINRDPYRIWVSEIMLQQTRVETVIPYYERFMQSFPTVEALSQAEKEVLMKHWEGLGYYTRAANLQKAAKKIVEAHGGVFPRDYASIRDLPGIGDYTAGAISSIAFEQPCPAVDGNVLRVLARVLTDSSDVMKPETRKRYTEILSGIYPEGRCGDFTQSLMELGALVCIPGVPRCGSCPLQGMCGSFQQGCTADYPIRMPKKIPTVEDLTVLLITDGTHLLISKRSGGLLGGMWEFPNLVGHLSKEEVERELGGKGFAVEHVREIGMDKHVFTHVKWHMRVYECRVGSVKMDDGMWVTEAMLMHDVMLPTAFRKLLGLKK